MPIKKPTNIKEFCDSLEKPYSLAKQYFDIVVLEIDFHNDSQYFYDRFSGLDEKLQDTVYNNLQHLYDVTKEVSNYSLELLRNKLQTTIDKSINSEEKHLENILNIFNNLGDEIVRNNKLSVLNQFIETADSYRRVSGAVPKTECLTICSQNKENYNDLKKERQKKERVILLYSITVSVVASVSLFLIILYFCAKVGFEEFISFFDSYLWTPICSVIVGGVVSLLVILFKFLKN